MLVLGVAVAGGLGAATRYVVEGVIQERWRGPFPMGTFVINVSGSLVLGTLTGFFTHHIAASSDVETVVGTGFVGAYTTFSTLMYETLVLLRGGGQRYAFANLLGTLVAATAAAAAGVWLGGSL